MKFNILVGKIGEKEIQVIQSFIKSKESGCYELKEIFPIGWWSSVIRPQFLGRVISTLVDEGVFHNIKKNRKKTNKHIEYIIF